MKTILTTCLALAIAGCGDGGQGSRDFPLRDLPPPSGQSQTPQRPSDSVPPLSSQAPATNSQLPPANTQSAGPAGVTCRDVIVALQNAGCTVSLDDAAECETYTIANSPCAQQIQSWFSCLLMNPVCTAEGDVSRNTCPRERDAAEACLEGGSSNPPSRNDCTPAGNCSGCGNTCDSCRCAAETNPDLGPTCDSLC